MSHDRGGDGQTVVISDVVNGAAIAAMFGVSRPAVTRWAARPDFPRPLPLSVGARVWSRAEVAAWREARLAEREKHGARRYRRGCRCPTCRDGHRTRQSDYRDRRKARLSCE